MRGLALALALSLGASSGLACGGTTHLGEHARHLGADLTTVNGVRVVALRRHTPDVVFASLWIDAGSRDADPPELATAAAWLAADRGGRGVEARVVPDGTAFEIACDASALDACVGKLARAIATRDVRERDVARLRRRLEVARRRAATDASRRADGLALEALLGDREAHAMLPLGRTEDDARVTRASLRAFLAAHYGPRRALAIAAGDVSSDALDAAVERSFDELPAATNERAARRLTVVEGARAKVEVGDETIAAVAAALPSLDDATSIARALVDADPTDGAHVSVSAFELRGAAIVVGHVALARADHADRIASATCRLLIEGAPHAVAPRPDDPVEAARALGAAWTAGEAAGPSTPALGLGLVADGGRGDARDDAPDAALEADVRERTERAVALAWERREPRVRGRVSEDAAAVVVEENAARIDARRRRGDERVAVAIRFEGGAERDPPDLAGRTALLAYAATTACAGLRADALRARVERLGLSMSPLVDAGSWGVVVEGPSAAWPAAIDLAIRCASEPSLERHDLETARLRLLSALDPVRALAARAAAPTAPGAIAPLGDAEAVRLVPADALRDAARHTVTGGRAAVAIVGDVPIGAAVDAAARRLSPLRRGTVDARPASVDAPEDPIGFDWHGQAPRVIVAVRARAPSSDDAATAARAFARALGESLHSVPGLSEAWSDGGAVGGEVWAAIALDATNGALDELPVRVARAQRSCAERANAWLPELRRARARLLARPSEAAASLSLARLEGARPEENAAGVLAALASARPAFAIGHPR